MKIKNIILILITQVCLWACSQKPETGEKSGKENPETVTLTQAQMVQAEVSAGPLQQATLATLLEVNGRLDVPPQNMVSVSAMMGGFVLKTNLLQGLKVKKGDEILVLQNPDFITEQQAYVANQSRLAFLQTEMKRQQELAGEQVAPAKTYQQSRADYQSLEATQNGLREKLKLMGFSLADIEKGRFTSTLSVRAPIAGNVTDVAINLGKYIAPQDLICEIVNTDHLHAELSVFEEDLSKIAVGQHVYFHLQGEPEKERHAHIYLINKKMNADRTVRVHAHLDEEDKNLIPNRLIKAQIETGFARYDVLPTEAIVEIQNQNYVFVQTSAGASGTVFKKIAVKKGISQAGKTAVTLLEKVSTKALFATRGAIDLLHVLENVEEEE